MPYDEGRHYYDQEETLRGMIIDFMCNHEFKRVRLPMILKLFLLLFIAPFLSFMVASWLIGHFILRLRKGPLDDLCNLKVEHHYKSVVGEDPQDFILIAFGMGLLTLPF